MTRKQRGRVRVPLGVLFGVLAAVGHSAGARAQEAGRDPQPGQPQLGGVTVIDADHPVTTSGTLDLWRAASTQGARVMLKVYRPDGDRLVLVGASPLETITAGEVATFPCRIPVARNDLIGYYCPDSSCIDAFVDGTTLSAAGDLGTSDASEFSQGVGGPALFASGTLLADVPSGANRELVVPVVARTPGANGTVWSTSLELFNTTDSEAEVALFFNRSNQDNTTPAASAQAVIGPRETMRFDDLLDEAFGLVEDVGSLDILSTGPVFAHARVANFGGSSGSFGQSVPAVPAGWALGEDDVPGANPSADIATLFECREDADTRCNLGIANVESVALTVIVTGWDGLDSVGSPLILEIPPYSHTQVNRVVQTMGISVDGGVRLEIAAAVGSTGRFFAYLSNVDNLSGDAVFLVGDREPTLP